MTQLTRRERAITALIALGGKRGFDKREKGISCSWVHSPARPADHPDDHASVQVYDSGFYKDHGGFEYYWAKFGLKPVGTLELLERATGKKPTFDDVWHRVFPAQGKSLSFIQERLLNKEFVGGDDTHVYFPLRDLDRRLVGIQTRTIEGKSYRVLENSEKNACFHPEGLEWETIYLTEGSTDTFSLLSFLPNVVGLLSCSWLSYLEQFPKNKNYISLFDNDEAGYAANLKLKEILPVQFVDFCGKKDVNEWLTTDPKSFLNILSSSTRMLSPTFSAVSSLREAKRAAATVRKVTLDQIGALPPFQALQLSPFSANIPTGSTVCATHAQLQNGIPIVVRDVTRLQAEWIAYQYETTVYFIEDDRPLHG